MLKKILFICFFILSSLFAFGERIEEYQKKNEKEIQTSISNLNKQNQQISVVVADVFSADAFLKALPNVKKGKISEVLLLLPDASIFRDNIKAISNKVNKIYVVFSKDPLSEDNLNNRSYVEYTNLGMIDNLDNVIIYQLPIAPTIRKHIVSDSINKNVLDTDLYRLVKSSGVSIKQD